MNFTKFTDESKYLINDSQNKAIENSNQQIMPEHLLKAMFDKKTEIFYEIITTIGRNFHEINERLINAINTFPKVSGENINILFSSDLLKVFDKSLTSLCSLSNCCFNVNKESSALTKEQKNKNKEKIIYLIINKY